MSREDTQSGVEVDHYTAVRGDSEVFVIDADDDGECRQWVAAENPMEVQQ